MKETEAEDCSIEGLALRGPMAAIECLFRCILPHSRKVRVKCCRVASSFIRQQHTRPSEDDGPGEVSIFHT